MHYIEVTLRFVPHGEGGRSSVPDLKGGVYRPHLRVAPSTEYLGVAFVSEALPLTSGDNILARAALIYDVDYAALQPDAAFDVLEGPYVVATGKVLRRFERGGSES